MEKLDDVEELRLKNLKFLHGMQPGYGAPTSKKFSQHLQSLGVRVSEGELSDFYSKKKKIDFFVSQNIEDKFGLPEGWMSVGKEFLLEASAGDLKMFQIFPRLPDDIKFHVRELVFALAKNDED
ncbi:hypothetical protein [Halomonas sp. PGE1]|uniref:hypothetical protein n=1 Tax=Halomonas sp. PGE1 TaxID=2730360 RepID=UPI0014741E14|nr:hypothetical protein [Halomonas sp. PGE1]QJQ99494.1 hypothetical protein HIR79_12980 [Halomonas sp. PGE1]